MRISVDITYFGRNLRHHKDLRFQIAAVVSFPLSCFQRHILSFSLFSLTFPIPEIKLQHADTSMRILPNAHAHRKTFRNKKFCRRAPRKEIRGNASGIRLSRSPSAGDIFLNFARPPPTTKNLKRGTSPTCR